MKRFLIATTMVGALLAFAAGVTAQVSAEVALRAAIEQETVKGDLNGAIEQYKKIVAQYPDNHAIAARALLRMAGSYEKLGNPEYRNVYARVAAQYADQPEAAPARARLSAKAAEESPAAAPTEVLLWKTTEMLRQATASPSRDGSFIVYRKASGLWRHDFAGGEDRIITADSGIWPEVSPDGRFVAYGLLADHESQLRVIGIDGSGMRVLAKADERVLVAADAWSPDGTRMLVHYRDKELALMSVADGSLTVVQSGGIALGSTPNAFSPDGRYIVYHNLDDRAADPAKAQYVLWIMDASGGGAERLLSDPADVTSRDPMWAPDGRSILFRSKRSGSWALWSVAMADGKAQGSPQPASNEDLECLSITADGSLFRSAAISQTNIFTVSMDPKTLKVTSAPQQLNRLFIGQAYGPTAWSPDGRAIAYNASRGNLIVHSMTTDEDRVIKPAGTWVGGGLLRYSSDGSALVGYTLTRAQSGRNSSHFSRIDLQTGNETPLFDVQNSSDTVLAPDDRTVYYCPTSSSPDGAAVASIVRRNVQSGEEKQLVQVSGKELGDISVSPDGQEIAFQYVGADGVRRIMVVPSGGGAALELAEGIYTLGISPWTGDSRHLFVMSSAGASFQYWSIPVEGGAPQLAGSGPAVGFTVSPQTDRIASTQTQNVSELKLYRNLLPLAPAR